MKNYNYWRWEIVKNYDIKQVHFTERKISAVFKANESGEVVFPIIGVALLQDDWGHKTIKALYLNSKGSIEPIDEKVEDFICMRSESQECQCKGSH